MNGTDRQEEYQAPVLLRNAHLGTIAPSLLRRPKAVPYTRLTLDTADGDFLDIDTLTLGHRQAAILLHGLEGSSRSTYIIGMAHVLAAMNTDVIALNQRSCSGRMNRLPGSYHSGKTDDLDFVVNHFAPLYDHIFVIGFSLGGNIALKWAGEYASTHPHNVRAVAAISVPCDLSASSDQLARWQNRIYLHRFLRQLVRKVKLKMAQFPMAGIDKRQLASVSTFRDFDNLYTAPYHGFHDAEDYYRQCSARSFIPRIAVPTLVINALNDPFLTESCHAREECAANPRVRLLTPAFGGHVGFASTATLREPFWHELRISEFLHKRT